MGASLLALAKSIYYYYLCLVFRPFFVLIFFVVIFFCFSSFFYEFFFCSFFCFLFFKCFYFVLFLFSWLSFLFFFQFLKYFLLFLKKLFFPSSFSKSQHKSGHLFCENARPPYSSTMSVSMTTNKFIAWYVDLTAFDSFIKFSFINWDNIDRMIKRREFSIHQCA